MIDIITDDLEPPDTPPAGWPSFVRYREIAPSWEITHWSPEITGFDPVDFQQGRQHAATAMTYACRLGDDGTKFLLAVLCSMQFRSLGAIERGFMAGLVPLALAGTLPPVMSAAMVADAALVGASAEGLRKSEAFMAESLRGGAAVPELFYNYVLELIEGPREFWAGAALYMLAGAALNGGPELTEKPANAGPMQGKFQPGRSGNPAGKRPGTRNKATLDMQTLLDKEGKALTRKAIDLAKGGDLQALKLCLDRILPPRKDRPVSFDLPAITSAAEAANTMAAILAAVASGQITPGEAAEVGKLVESYVKAVEAADLSARIAKLEQRISA